jgi:hypothetical protein
MISPGAAAASPAGAGTSTTAAGAPAPHADVTRQATPAARYVHEFHRRITPFSLFKVRSPAGSSVHQPLTAFISIVPDSPPRSQARFSSRMGVERG